MKVAICGALGFVGTRVARDLAAAGHEPLLLDVAPRSPHPLAEVLLRRHEFRRCDLTDPMSTRIALAGAEAVFHAAALGAKVERERPWETAHLNLMGLVNVLEAARRERVARLVFASSAVVYGDRDATAPVAETDPRPAAGTIYAATKAAGEDLVAAYGAQFALHGVSLRFMNVYGYQPAAMLQRELTARVLERVEAGEPPLIFGDGTASFDFVHVDDVARAVCLALASDATGALNVGTGVATSVRELVALVLRETGSALQPEHRPGGGAATTLRADTAAAAAALGFRTAIDLAEGIRRTITEYRAAVEPRAA
jgi:UDP-glucose 4-epimerase